MKVLAIDGACYHNGKPDSVACGAFAGIDNDSDVKFIRSDLKHNVVIERGGTNQRGELLGLVAALEYIVSNPGNFIIVTDSEYVFNAMTKDWILGWIGKNWVTSSGTPVKNMDLWKRVHELRCEAEQVCEDAPAFYHLKGHIISFGTATRNELIINDPTGFDLVLALSKKYSDELPTRAAEVEHAQEISKRNNGFEFEPKHLKRFVVLNMLADAFASGAIEKYK